MSASISLVKEKTHVLFIYNVFRLEHYFSVTFYLHI